MDEVAQEGRNVQQQRQAQGERESVSGPAHEKMQPDLGNGHIDEADNETFNPK